MSDVVIGVLRLRGPHAGRLARVAATALPAALDAALAGYPDGRVDAVSVPFPVDAGSDDATIAALWAEAIRAAVHDELGRPVIGPRAFAPLPPAAGWTPPTATDAVLASLSWVAGGARPDAVPRDAWMVGHPLLVDECRHLLGGRWAVVVAALAGPVAGRSATTPRPSSEPGPRGLGTVRGDDGDGLPRGPGTSRDAGDDTRTDPHATPGEPAAGPPTARTASGPVAAPGTGPSPAHRVELAADLALASTVADLLDETTPTVVDTTLLTTAAGLVLLYPWLADHCRAAVALHPGLDPAEVRARALAVLVSADGIHGDDPLVRRLAGLDRPVEHPVGLTHEEELVASADAVLRSFAALLPGFERSSPDFVRREWVSRVGLLDEHPDPVRLTAATRRLDIVLDHLPYPLGLFALPWCPPMTVRFRP
ncbi:MAG TPA: contractile injection system tape measure protein [Ornithinibacter sp.]|nr:contractile injection system tape measure protein [Ornithinibacter sp.]